MKKIILLALMASTFLSAPVLAQKVQPYYPEATWQTKLPKELKVDAAWLDSAVAFAKKSENGVEKDLRVANLKAYVREPDYKIMGPMKERGGPNGVIIKNGYIIAQWGKVERVDMTFSVTKSVLSTVAGLAYDKGLIRNINDPVSAYVWDGTFQGEHNSKVTWEHLLQQTSDWYGCLHGICDWADRPPREGTVDDWRNRKLLTPGTTFEYNDVRVNLLAYSLLHVLRKPLPMVLKDQIMDPIGASTTWRWYGYEDSFVNIDGIMMQSVSGGGHFGGGLFINTMDQARLGLLFLRDGKWKDKQLISRQWIDMARKPSVPNKSYGYMWWTNEEGTFKSAPRSMYYANGFGGNYIFIDQEHDLLIVVRWMDGNKLDQFLGLTLKAFEGK